LWKKLKIISKRREMMVFGVMISRYKQSHKFIQGPYRFMYLEASLFAPFMKKINKIFLLLDWLMLELVTMTL